MDNWDPEDIYDRNEDLERGDEPARFPICDKCKTMAAMVYYTLPDVTLCKACKEDRDRHVKV